MSRMRLIFVALGALSVLAVAAPAAQAQGTMAELGCVIPPGEVVDTTSPPVENIVDDTLDPGGALDTETGDFRFNGNLACAGADAAGPAAVPPGTYNLAAVGTHENLLCGTGTANGTASLNGVTNPTSITSDFGLRFAAGVGKLTLVVDGGVVQVGASLETVTGGQGTGVISIVPNPLFTGGNCIITSVNRFFVNGGFELSVSG
jgi:hypothetical protein